MRIRKYFVPPPFISSYFEYQDLNKDKEHIVTIVKYMYEKTLVELVKRNKKNLAKKLDNDDGMVLIFKLMVKYLKKNNYKWTDFKKYYYPLKNHLVLYLMSNVKS